MSGLPRYTRRDSIGPELSDTDASSPIFLICAWEDVFSRRQYRHMLADDRKTLRVLHECSKMRLKPYAHVATYTSDRNANMQADASEKEGKTDTTDIEQGREAAARRDALPTGFWSLMLALSILLIVFYIASPRADVDSLLLHLNGMQDDVCPQAPALSPAMHMELLKDLEHDFESQDFKLAAYEDLGGAIRIPTEMFDDLKPPGEDPHWEIFGQFHAYLESTFPLVHTSLQKTLVNSYALVYHWQGSDGNLKPLLLTAHQDVVPVEPGTIDTWKHHPFSGYYDGEWIWGRGSCDDKSGLISSLTAIEKLLEKNFKPARTIVLAYGIDEERGGVSGATAIRDYLLSTYGENASSALIDEGGKQEIGDNVIVAAPAVAEKGSFNLRMEVATPGGHSSVPPAHTSIGMLAALVTELEAHPHVSNLYRTDTFYQELQCLAVHNPDFPQELARLVNKSRYSDKALNSLAKFVRAIPEFRPITATTQAVDIIQGGVKTNALPESAHAIVNHRIAGYSSVAALKARLIDVLAPVATRFDLSIDAFGQQISGDITNDARLSGRLTLSDAFGTGLEPAPITPTGASPPWVFLSGVVRNVLSTSSRETYAGKAIVVAPSILLGNTDTKHYWSLTKHIFRYSHRANNDAYNGAHTVNEAIRAEGFMEMIRFFTQVILVSDETDLL